MNYDDDIKDINLQPATFQKRLTASAVDFLFASFSGLILSLIINSILVHAMTFAFYIIFVAFWFAMHFLNVIIYQNRSGRSLGKYLLKLKVCYLNNKIDVRNEDITKREIAKLWTLITGGYSFFSQYKKEEIICFHDEYSKTCVLNLSEEHEAYLYEYHYEEYYHSEEEEEEYEKTKKELEEFKLLQKEEERKEKEFQKQVKQAQKTATENTGAGAISNINNIPPNISSEPITQGIVPYGEGINIVGDSGFLNTEEEEKKTISKLVNILRKNGQNTSPTTMENQYLNAKLSHKAQDHTFLPYENIYSQSYKGWSLSDIQYDKENKVIAK